MTQTGAVHVHLVDGTYELFRQFYGRNSGQRNAQGVEVGAVRGALRSTFALLNDGATHVGVACLLYTSPSPRDRTRSRMPSSA